MYTVYMYIPIRNEMYRQNVHQFSLEKNKKNNDVHIDEDVHIFRVHAIRNSLSQAAYTYFRKPCQAKSQDYVISYT